MTVVVDETKLMARLGGNTRLSAKILSFGWQTVLDRGLFRARPGHPHPDDRELSLAADLEAAAAVP